ncbi:MULTISPECIES: thymidine kinase [Novosphingobium]|jgi:thymidine kinase|uniref:thymidine kinase n=1 Tax=Novosphingobium TaxID=165696 RepID=UPI0022F265C7|nr:thymidine kinase [Novosphingobium resinovorum]GLK43481.1 thymidine kinase [Novosphingobium resinovorum]
MAKLYFYYASMNAGKSTTLLQAAFNYRERGMKTMLWTAAIDDRSADMGADHAIESRIGLHASAHRFGPLTDLCEQVRAAHAVEPLSCVLVDEAQFLTAAQAWQCADIADKVGIPVLCYGLRTDFRGDLFPGAAILLGIADSLIELKAVCHCGRKASMNLRVDDGGRAVSEGAQTEIGGNDRYVALCRRHFSEALGR